MAHSILKLDLNNNNHHHRTFAFENRKIADCDTRDFTDQKREEMLVSDFIGRCLQIEGSAVQCNNEYGTSKGHTVYVPYLKDWHFVKLDNFRMNTYSDTNQQNKEICCSDYRFVYMGMKGSWTPLHADVFRSYSWSANVCGKKRWFFIDPSQSHLVFDMHECILQIETHDIFVCKFYIISPNPCSRHDVIDY